MSQVYNISSTFHQQLERVVLNIPIQDVEKIRMKKLLLSLPVMKSKIGRFYYMEKKAKLTLLDNMARGIAFMLAAFK
jgi:hypothetical protein